MKKFEKFFCFLCIIFLPLGLLPLGLFAQQVSSASSAQLKDIMNGDYSEDSHFKKIQKRGVLIVAIIQKDQYPFFYKTKAGSLVGLDIKIAKNLAESLQVRLQIDRTAKSFNDLIPLVETGEADMALSKLSRTLVRSRRVLFSNPYIVFRQALLVNRIELARVSSSDAETKNVIRDFAGSLGVIGNSSYEQYAKVNFPQAEIVSFPTWEDTLQAVADSKVFAIYRDEMEISRYIKDNPAQNFYFQSVVIDDRQDPISIAVPAQAQHFLFYLNLFLLTLDFLPKDTSELLNNFG